MLDLVTHLADRSLVQVEERSGDIRYRVLETIRQYAARRLTDAAEAIAVRNLEHMVGIAERAERELEGGGIETWLDRLDIEEDNLRVAMDGSVGSTDADRAQRLVAAPGRGASVVLDPSRGWRKATALWTLALAGGEPPVPRQGAHRRHRPVGVSLRPGGESRRSNPRRSPWGEPSETAGYSAEH